MFDSVIKHASTDQASPKRGLLRKFLVVLSTAGLFFLSDRCSNVARGAEPRRLTQDGRLKQTPVFTDRGGNTLVYVVQERPVQFRLMRLNMADLKTEPLRPEEKNCEFDPAYSPDGRYLAFVQSRGNLSLGMVIRDLTSGTDADIPAGGGFAGPSAPTFRPDGSALVYSFPEGGRQQLFTATPQGKNIRSLVDTAGINNWPSFSPDGKRLVFSSTRDGNFEIYIADADGNNPRRLTTQPKQDIRPRFSPDGKRIAFTSNRDGNYEIYVMNAEGGEVARVTDNPERDDYAAWHPDGKRLAIISERKGKQDVYLVDVP